MLDVSTDGSTKTGPLLTVDDVRGWIEGRRDRVSVAMAPAQIPGGWWAAVTDPFGNPTYVIDQSTADRPG
ncbi:hypothetical protein [Flexivirga oryzae]|uniref:Glyoxalase-like domain-containing protein n=1 Tax=Flexivirga oryzae TaxID=1794944 RepID=A0A839NHQ3_9MICO|nr:hypothetical protein [Flexivirga oryzae]MBB2894201.1 hypothetical protein [Flexivirga oryzae]MBB2894771.1 hypothetical protein [Flexivirga oryzae]